MNKDSRTTYFTFISLLILLCTSAPLLAQECEDSGGPQLTCRVPTNVSLSILEGTVTVFATDLVIEVTDDCTPTEDIELLITRAEEWPSTELPTTTSLTFAFTSAYNVVVLAMDTSGNLSWCTTIVNVLNTEDNCTNDQTPPNIACFNGLEVAMTPDGETIIFPSDPLVSAFDNCDGDNVDLAIGIGELQADSSAFQNSVVIPNNESTLLSVRATDQSGNSSVCWTVATPFEQDYLITGQIFIDESSDCQLGESEEGATGLDLAVVATVEDSDTVYEAVIYDDGRYLIAIPPSALEPFAPIELNLQLPNGLNSSCPTVAIINDFDQLEESHDFGIELQKGCEYLTVDISTAFLRRCFATNYYLTYANYSAQEVEDVNIEVQLDPFLLFVQASVPAEDLGEGLYSFSIGQLASGETGRIEIIVVTDCEAELGQTHCVTAEITPFTCNEETAIAELVVSGECDESTGEVHFSITNIGDAPMAEAKRAQVVEDVLLFMEEFPIDLDIDESIDFSYTANGATWRLNVPQEEDFPFGGMATAFVEGCNGFTQGMATRFLNQNSRPNISIDCQENRGAYDPNDKQAMPTGHTEANYIEANIPIEYMIRFQNTGTDTAFNVYIEDQIDPALDIKTLVPGASSHDYRMEQLENGLIRFFFDNIMLPDSNVNEPASNGFIKFSIQQLADNPIGTRIENTAGIYFDFNAPVITNTVYHTIGKDFLLVQTQEAELAGIQLRTAPNPMVERAMVTVEGHTLRRAQLHMHDWLGRPVQTFNFQGQQCKIERGELPAGVYFYQVTDDKQLIVQGKIVIQ